MSLAKHIENITLLHVRFDDFLVLEFTRKKFGVHGPTHQTLVTHISEYYVPCDTKILRKITPIYYFKKPCCK